MAFQSQFIDIELNELMPTVEAVKAESQRFVQILAVRNGEGLDLVYSFMKGETLTNYRICQVALTDEVPSISGLYLEAFVFENEAHDLFGANIKGIAIDFGGTFYAVSEPNPMMVPAPVAAKPTPAPRPKKEVVNE